MSKKQQYPRQDRVHWGRIITWTWLGFMYTISGTENFILSEIIALLFGLVRFGAEWERTRHPERSSEGPRKFHESKVIGISFAGWIVAMATLGSMGLDGNPVIGLLSPALGAFAAFLNYLWQNRSAEVIDDTPERPMSKKLAAHYEAAGLSDSEVSVFRETMAGASKNIHQLQTTVDGAPELQDIMNEHDTMNVIHAYFRAIVDQPKRMTAAAPFLYEQLPNLADLTHKYAIITRHEVKTKDTYLVLSQAKDALDKLCKTVRDEYTDFVKSDLEDLDTTVELTKRQLDK